jgi:hypothetical protein
MSYMLLMLNYASCLAKGRSHGAEIVAVALTSDAQNI